MSAENLLARLVFDSEKVCGRPLPDIQEKDSRVTFTFRIEGSDMAWSGFAWLGPGYAPGPTLAKIRPLAKEVRELLVPGTRLSFCYGGPYWTGAGEILPIHLATGIIEHGRPVYWCDAKPIEGELDKAEYSLTILNGTDKPGNSTCSKCWMRFEEAMKAHSSGGRP